MDGTGVLGKTQSLCRVPRALLASNSKPSTALVRSNTIAPPIKSRIAAARQRQISWNRRVIFFVEVYATLICWP
jgi:hypothetical protein